MINGADQRRTVDGRLLRHPFASIGESEHKEQEQQAARNDDRKRSQWRGNELPPKQKHDSDQAVPQQVPVAEQEEALAELPPRRLEIEMQSILEDGDVRLCEHREQKDCLTERDAGKFQTVTRKDSDEQAGDHGYCPEHAGIIDLRAGDEQ